MSENVENSDNENTENKVNPQDLEGQELEDWLEENIDDLWDEFRQTHYAGEDFEGYLDELYG
jgi:hypothetical protein